MTPYLLLGSALWLAMLKSQNGRSAKALSLLCLVMMIVFTGLRYEIGYDWLAYEQYFIWLYPSFSWWNYEYSQSVLPVEYLYFILNVSIKMIDGNIELLLFLISFFNLIVIDRVSNFIDPTSRPFVWFLYFCLALVMVQFNIIRQSVASSFILLSLMYSCKKELLKSIVLFFLAIGFHTSVFLFLPIVLLNRNRISGKYVIAAIVLAIIVLMAGNIFLGGFIRSVGSLLPGGISEKTDLYASGAEGNIWGISPLAAVLVALYMSMLAIFFRLPRTFEVNVAILLTLWVLIAHLAFGQVPIIWNRVMCVSLPWQLAVLWKYYVRVITPPLRHSGLLLGGALGLAVTAFQLTRPENIAFVPYHSLLQVWLFNDEGDGRLRSMYAVQQGQLEQTRAASQ